MKKILFFILFMSILNADNGNKMLQKAIKLINSKQDLPLAYKLLKKASSKNINASFILGKFYLSKNTPYYNTTKAFNSFLNAANNNHSQAQIIIARFFLQGKIVNKDYKKALYYFELSSKQKNFEANCYIAYMYAKGLGVFPNFGRAHLFAKDEYKKGNKLCIKIWNDYNLKKYPEDKGFKIGKYLKPLK